MEKIIEGGEPLNEETRQAMDELRKEGLEFEGDKPKEEPKKEEPKPEPKEEKPQLPSEKPEEKKEEHEEERKPREPRQIPAWKAEIEKKRLQKEWEEKSVKEKEELSNKVKELESELNNLKSSHGSDNDVGKQLKAIADEFSVEEGFLKKLYALIPKPEIGEEFKQKMSRIDELESKSRQESENIAYNKSFSVKVVPLLKENYPKITDEEIGKIQDKVKEYYFSEKYLNLDTDEIYFVKSLEFKKMVSDAPSGFEKGVKGLGREEIIDYGSLTEEEYGRLSSEEQEKANEILIANQRNK